MKLTTCRKPTVKEIHVQRLRQRHTCTVIRPPSFHFLPDSLSNAAHILQSFPFCIQGQHINQHFQNVPNESTMVEWHFPLHSWLHRRLKTNFKRYLTSPSPSWFLPFSFFHFNCLQKKFLFHSFLFRPPLCSPLLNSNSVVSQTFWGHFGSDACPPGYQLLILEPQTYLESTSSHHNIVIDI